MTNSGYHWYGPVIVVKSVTDYCRRRFEHTFARAYYLAVSQREDGGFYQKFLESMVDLDWSGISWMRVAFPVLLAWRLWKTRRVGNSIPLRWFRRLWVPHPRGPITPQDRWEEARGYRHQHWRSTSQLSYAQRSSRRSRRRCHGRIRSRLCRLSWNRTSNDGPFTTEGTLLPGITRH